MAVVDDLERWLSRRLAGLLAVRQATVVSAATGPPKTVALHIGGDTVNTVSGVRYLASYTPTGGDVVFLLEASSFRLVLGKLA